MTTFHAFGGSVSAPRSLREIQTDIVTWHELRFGELDPSALEYMSLKICEEAGEVASAVIGMKGTASATGSGDVLEECVDVLITTLALMGRIYPSADVENEVAAKLAILNDPASGHRASLS